MGLVFQVTEVPGDREHIKRGFSSPSPLSQAPNSSEMPVTAVSSSQQSVESSTVVVPLEDTTKENIESHQSHKPQLAVDDDGAPPPRPMSRARFWVTFLSLMLCVLLASLDQLITAVATPKITDEFDSLDQVSWLSNAFFICQSGFTLSFGQYQRCFPSKYCLLVGVFIFEIGSLVCGVSPSMTVLILGRALAGVGAAGIIGSTFQVLIEITTLQERPKYISLFGLCTATASIFGPIVGGAFSDSYLGWRWCFYINLPLGGIALCIIFFFSKASPPLRKPGTELDTRPVWRKFIELDFFGTITALAFTTVLSLGLAWGGNQYAWSSPQVIVLLVMIPVCLAILAGWSALMGEERALFPIMFLKSRAVLAAGFLGLFGWMCSVSCLYYLSIQFQAVYGKSSITAGEYLLSMVLVQTTFTILGGRLVTRLGHYRPLLTIGPCFLTIGAGFLITMGSTTAVSHSLGFQSLLGAGLGMFIQNCGLSVQVAYKKQPQYLAQGVGVYNFITLNGRILGLSIASIIFTNTLPKQLQKHAPNLPPGSYAVIEKSVETIRNTAYVPLSMRSDVIDAYMASIHSVFIFVVVSAGCAVLASFAIPPGTLHKKNTSTKNDEKPKDVEMGEAQQIEQKEHAA